MRSLLRTLGALCVVLFFVHAQPAPVRFLVARGERLKVPGTPTANLPSEANGSVCRWEKKGDAWWVEGLAVGVQRFRWADRDWELLVQERALKLPGEWQGQTFGDYPVEQALLHWMQDRLFPTATLEWSAGQLLARGPELIPAQGLPRLKVEPRPIEPGPAQHLVLSNWPEKVTADQILLEVELPAGEASRVMLHHRNMPDQPARWLEIELLSEAGGAVAISPALAGPSGDEIFAGHLATQKFLRQAGGEQPQGYWVELGPGGRHLLERWVMKPAQTVSGMLWLQPEKPTRLRISARQPDNLSPLEPLPLEEARRTTRGRFAAERRLERVITAGPSYHFEELGQQQLEDGTRGDFGVVYRHLWILDNPSPEPREFRLDISARGGPARAFLWIEGRLIETGLLKAEPQPLQRWVVAPQSRLQWRSEIFPQAGSNYPVTLQISSRPAPPEAEASLENVDPWGWFIP